MLGIQAIGSAMGALSIDNLAQGERFGKSPDFMLQKIGFRTLRRLAPQQDALSLCVDAYENLQTKADFSPASCDCLVLVTQNPPEGKALPHISALLQARLGLPQTVAAFDMGLGCSGYVYALHVMIAFMRENGLKQGLLFTADPYSTVLDAEDANTSLLFGDAAACTLVSEKPLYVPGKACFATDGSKAEALKINPDGHIFMQGRAIFNFGMLAVPPQVERCLAMNGLAPENVDCLLLHQASRYIVESMGQRMGFGPEKIPFVLEDVGNCVSSTLPLALDCVRPAMHECIVMSGFGVGLSWATTVLYCNEDSHDS